jgi:DNA-binding LacI/PurR family transcriptional regulator
VAIVGFDDSVIATWTEPPLSSVRQPIEEMGRKMARLLLESIAGRRGVRHEILPTELVVRASSVG